MKKIYAILLLVVPLFATIDLQHSYIVTHPYVYLSDIVGRCENDTILLHFKPSKHTARIKEQQLRRLLAQHGYETTHHYSYIQFSQKSPVDTQKIQHAVEKLYKKLYSKITIQEVIVSPRNFITELPKKYTVHFTKKSHLYDHAIFYIQTPQKKRIFFEYRIKAFVDVMQTRTKVSKGEELTTRNMEKKSIMLQRFFAMPLQTIQKGLYQAKHTLKKGMLVTRRDIVALAYVHRKDKVSIVLQDGALKVQTTATALQNGALGDIIQVRTATKKIIKVRITGRNKAEVI